MMNEGNKDTQDKTYKEEAKTKNSLFAKTRLDQ